MNLIVVHRTVIVTIIQLLIAAYAIYVAFALKRKNKGEPLRHKPAIFVLGIALVISASFMFAVFALSG